MGSFHIRRIMGAVALSAVLLAGVQLRQGGIAWRGGPVCAGAIPMPSFGPNAIGPGDVREGVEWWSLPARSWMIYVGLVKHARYKL